MAKQTTRFLICGKTMDNGTSIPSVISDQDNNKKRFSTTLSTVTSTKQENRKCFKSLVGDFASSTSAHGIGKIYTAQSHLRRALWSFGCILVYAVMFWMCIQLLLRFLAKPVVSRVEVGYEESLVFPAVTICNLNMLKVSEIRKRASLSKKLTGLRSRADQLMSKQPSGQKQPGEKDALDKELDARKAYYRDRLKERAKSKKERKIFGGAEVDTSNMMQKFFDKMVGDISPEEASRMGYSLDEMVVGCRWSQYKCTSGTLKDLWRHFWHWKYGNCYTFNSGIGPSGQSLPILTVERAGPYAGLELLVNVNQRQYQPFTDEAGVRIVLTDQGKMPFPFDEGFSVPTGFSTSVGIRRVNTRRVDPYGNRSCVAQDTNEDDSNIYRKKYYVNYSVQTCRNSCLAVKQWKLCNCSETRFPSNSSSNCVTDEQSKCASKVSSKYLRKGLQCVRDCPQPCLDNNFRYTVSSARWSARYMMSLRNRFGQFLKSPAHANQLGDNFLKVTLFYEELSLEKVIYEEAYPLENLLADFGGQLGLWIGVSVLTVAELLDLLFNLLRFAWERSRKVDAKKDSFS